MSKKHTRARRRTRKITLETLEPRALLSADVHLVEHLAVHAVGNPDTGPVNSAPAISATQISPHAVDRIDLAAIARSLGDVVEIDD
jgi:hypothetical protein